MSDAQIPPACSRCKFFAPNTLWMWERVEGKPPVPHAMGDDYSRGECRRRRPTSSKIPISVSGTYWCGEFKASDQ